MDVTLFPIWRTRRRIFSFVEGKTRPCTLAVRFSRDIQIKREVPKKYPSRKAGGGGDLKPAGWGEPVNFSEGGSYENHRLSFRPDDHSWVCSQKRGQVLPDARKC